MMYEPMCRNFNTHERLTNSSNTVAALLYAEKKKSIQNMNIYGVFHTYALVLIQITAIEVLICLPLTDFKTSIDESVIDMLSK